MGRAEQDRPEPCPLEECCCGPLLLRGTGGLSKQVLVQLRFFRGVGQRWDDTEAALGAEHSNILEDAVTSIMGHFLNINSRCKSF